MRRILVLLLALGNVAIAAALSVTAPAAKRGGPGDYVTLVFRLDGHGDVRLSAAADGGATVLTPGRQMKLDGQANYFVTVQVPDTAKAGEQISVRLEAIAPEGVVGRAESRIDVAAVVSPQLSLDRNVKALIGSNVQVHGYVSNAGNTPDRLTLRPVDPAWPTTVAPQSVELTPGESVPVVVTVVPSSGVSFDYRYLVRVQASSSKDSGKVASAQSLVTFTDPQQEAIRKAGSLALVFGVRAAGLVSASLESGAWSVDYQYSMKPSLKGALSDYVQAEVNTTPIHGDQSYPFSAPDLGAVTLDAGNWTAGLHVTASSVGLTGSVNVGDWQVSMGSGVSFGGGRLAVSGTAGLSNLAASPDLDLTGSVFVASGAHHEHLGVRYTYDFTPSISLGGGADAYGVGTVGGAYYVIPAFSLSGRYRGSVFSSRIDYSALPTFGEHTASAGISSTSPANPGFTVTATGSLSPLGQHATASAAVYGFPVYGVGLSGGLRFNEVSEIQDYGDLTATIQASAAFPLPYGGRGGAVGSYAHTLPLWGTAATAEATSLSIGAAVGILQATLGGSYNVSGPRPDLLPNQSIVASGSVSVTPLATTTLSAHYTFTDVLLPDVDMQHAYGATWNQSWGWGVSSLLDYERTWDYPDGLPPTQPESLTATLSMSNFLLPGLNLQLSYGIASDVSLFDFNDPHKHTFTVGFGYGLRIPFKTPQTVVQLFGGRKTGVLFGRALVRTGGTLQPLKGLTVTLGDQQSLTGPDGSYELRVPPGVYRLEFPSGLAATLGLDGDPQATVVLDQRVQRDLVFQPVANLTVTVFDDANGNGRRDANEHGLPYAGVSVTGPVTRSMRTDETGRAVFSGLPGGRYTVDPDPRFLPPGYRPTSSGAHVDISPPTPPAPQDVGAAKPPKTVVTTLHAGEVSIFGSVGSGQVPAGADLTVRAQTTGRVSDVSVEMFGTTTRMTGANGRWQATVQVPSDTATGFVTGKLVANAGDHATTTSLQFVVTHGKLYASQAITAAVGAPQPVAVRVLFKASEVTLKIGGTSFALTSQDGYLWQGTVTLTQGGQGEAHVVADGRDLGTLPVSVAKGGG